VPAALYTARILATAAPAWGAGLVAAGLPVYMAGLWLARRLDEPSVLAGVLRADVQERGILWSVDQTALRRYSDTRFWGWVSAAWSIGVTLYCLKLLHERGIISGVGWWSWGTTYPVAERPTLLFAVVISLMCLALGLARLRPATRMLRCIETRASQLAAVTSERDRRLWELDEVQALQRHLTSLARSVDAVFPVDHVARVRHLLVSAPRGELLDPERRRVLCIRVLAEAQIDVAGLEVSQHCRAEVAELLFLALREVARSRDNGLLRELDQLHDHGLRAPELQSLLAARRWKDHARVLREMRAELQALLEKATHAPDRKANRSESTSDAVRAREILGVGPADTRETIRAVYARLAGIYHPDRGLVASDEAMKRINWAYHVLSARQAA
nr:J domain-containing protein [Gemmatimonadota bacterium]